MKKAFWLEQKGRKLSTPFRSVEFDAFGYTTTDDETGDFLSRFKGCIVVDSTDPDPTLSTEPPPPISDENVTDEAWVIQHELNKNPTNT